MIFFANFISPLNGRGELGSASSSFFYHLSINGRDDFFYFHFLAELRSKILHPKNVDSLKYSVMLTTRFYNPNRLMMKLILPHVVNIF